MPGALRDRVGCLTALLSRPPQLQHVGVADALHAAFGFYGVARRRLARRVRCSPIDAELSWVELGEYGVSWPVGAPLDRLFHALVELEVPSNPHYYFEPLTRVSPGARVVDVGACEGAFAFECVCRRGAGRAWCFEPDVRMARGVRVAAERNGVSDRVEVIEAALGSVEGEVVFVESADPLTSKVWQGRRAPPGNRVRQVPRRTIDEWVRVSNVPGVDLLKIDAEGSDLAILQGARTTLARFRPAIAVTTYHDVDHCNQMVELLTRLDVGYQWQAKGMVCYNGVPRPVMLHAVPKR